MMQTVLSSIRDLPDLLRELQISKPLYVAGERWRGRLPEDAAVFSAFSPNPDFDQCGAGLCMFRRRACDALVAIGGGSCMDTAKTIKALLLSSSPQAAIRNAYPGSDAYPLILIPTTAGSGSEATQTAVVYVDGQKQSLSHPALLARAVILDAELLATLPPSMRRSCALDALCQGIESFWSKAATEESRSLASGAIREILRQIRPYMDLTGFHQEAASAMLQASYQAGQAIALTRTTAAHAMSYMITKKLGVPHGDACALTLPYLWMRLNQDPAFEATGRALSDLLEVGEEEAPLLFLGLCLDSGLCAPGLPDAAMLDFLTDSVNPERLNNHPQSLTRQEICSVYETALAGPDKALSDRALQIWRQYGTNSDA